MRLTTQNTATSQRANFFGGAALGRTAATGEASRRSGGMVDENGTLEVEATLARRVRGQGDAASFLHCELWAHSPFPMFPRSPKRRYFVLTAAEEAEPGTAEALLEYADTTHV